MKKGLRVVYNLKKDFNSDKKDELLMKIDEELLERKEIDFITDDTLEDKIEIQIINKNKDDVSFIDFKEEGNILKQLGIKYEIFDNNTYAKSFSIIEIKIKTDEANKVNSDELDKLIAKVPENDEKVLDIMNQLNKINKTK